jgi:hypothetical protein
VRAVGDAGHDTWHGVEFKASRGAGGLGKARPRAPRAHGRRGSGAGAAWRGRGSNMSVCSGLTAFFSKILNRSAQSSE